MTESDFSPDDDDQLQPQDSLVDIGVDDVLDEGYEPPDREPRAMRSFEDGEDGHESLDERLADEEPDVGAVDPLTGEPEGDWDIDELDGPRAGRLVAPDQGTEPDEESELIAQDVGIDGGAASAEEAAVHYIDDDE